MPKLQLNGAALHYEDVGSGPETIVFSHGLLFSTRLFDPQVAALKDRYRCVSYDHRGQGQSEVTADGYDMDTLSRDAIALIEQLGVGPCHFVGLSMGGMVGMRVAARRPELVRTLTLLDTSAEEEVAEAIPRFRLLDRAARVVGMRLLVGRVMPIMFGPKFLTDPSRAAERKRWREEILKISHAGRSRALEGVVTRKPILDELGRIRAPTLVMVGERDVATKPAKARRIHEAIAGSRLVVIPHAGHSSTIEEPAFVNAELERFLAEAKSRAA